MVPFVRLEKKRTHFTIYIRTFLDHQKSMFLCAGFDCISTSCTVHFHWYSRVGWGIFLESSMPGIPSYPGVDLWGSRSWVALISPLWLSAQSQLASRLPVGVTTGRMNATDLDKTCKQKKGFWSGFQLGVVKSWPQ